MAVFTNNVLHQYGNAPPCGIFVAEEIHTLPITDGSNFKNKTFRYFTSKKQAYSGITDYYSLGHGSYDKARG